jgi:hypothetical protein
LDNYLSIFPKQWKPLDKEKSIRLVVEPTFRYRIIYKISWTTIYIVSISKYKQMPTLRMTKINP